MKANLEWMNVTYDVEFAAPSFDLPGSITTVLHSLYVTIHPRYPIGTQNMHSVGGNLMSDVHVRITLFNGNGVIDVSVDKMSLVFSNLKTKEDLAVFRDCISLSEEALQNSLPNVSVRTVFIKPTLFFELGDGNEDACDHLLRTMGSSIKPDTTAFGNATVYPGVNLEFENSNEGWHANFYAFRDRTRTSSLILSCQAAYGTEGKFNGIESRVVHLELLLREFLNCIGLEMPVSTE